MNDRRARWIGAILLMLLIAAIVGIGAYRMGMAQGLALGMAQVEGGREAVYAHAWHAHGWYGGPGPWGFGFGYGFGFLMPLLFFFLFVAMLRMLYWRGHRGPWGRGRRGGGGWGGRCHHRHPHRRWRDDDDRDFRRGMTL
jgi:hypothetical protein